jgi:CHASE2 domain-containing sensor protein/nitrogen-specific signal transduction histidine kinase
MAGLRLTGTLQILEWEALDRFVRLRPLEPADPRIVLVTVGESDIAHLEQWPISDTFLAQTLERIKQQHPRVIGLDLYRDLPVEPGHSELIAAFESTPNLIGIEKISGDTAGATIAPPPALAKLEQTSASNILVDHDGTVRRILLSLRNSDQQTILGFAARVALSYLEAEHVELEAVDSDRQYLRLGKAKFLPLQANDGGYIDADVGGYQILSNFRHFRQPLPQVSLTQVLKGQIPPNLMRDRIVLIGTTAISLGDRLHTPLPSRDAVPGIPGVVIHADFISQILSAALDGRPLLRSWAEPWELGWIFVWAMAGAMVGWTLRSPQWTVLGVILTSGGVTVGTYFLFLQGWWVPLMPPLMALVSSAALSKSYILWDNLLLSKRQLEEYAQTLEQKVTERTQELNAKNQQLHAEIHEHQQTEIALQQSKEIAEEASRTKSRFLATMSHELRTPLNAIIGFAQLLLEDTLPTSSHYELINIIHRSGDHLMELINNILTMSKLEAGRTTLYLDCFDIHDMIETLGQMFRLRAESNGVKFIVVQAPDLPRLVITDGGKVRQILINLLGNAVKFTERGKISLRVWGQANTSQSYTLFFAVEDTGPGIADHELSKLFQPFEQTTAGQRLQQGTGLGLAISYEFTRIMGGEITVSSQVNQGSVFRFYIQVELPDTSHLNGLFQPVTSTAEYSQAQALIAQNGVLAADNLQSPIQSDEEIAISDRLSAMPPEWIEKLHQAATRLDDNLITELIGQIPNGYTDLAKNLTYLADNFRYDLMIELIQQSQE